MKSNNRLFLLGLSFIFLCSCNQKAKHEKAIKYFAAITTEMQKTTAIVNGFWDDLTNATETAQQNEDKKLDSIYIDSLNNSYRNSNLAISTSIEKISELEETDKEINLKEKTLANLNETKILQESALPDVIKALGTGLDKLTDQQRESFKQFKLKGGELQISSAELKELFGNFQDKYKITNEEIAKYSLLAE